MKLLSRYKDSDLIFYTEQALSADPRIDNRRLTVNCEKGVITITSGDATVRGSNHITMAVQKALSHTRLKYDKIVNKVPAG